MMKTFSTVVSSRSRMQTFSSALAIPLALFFFLFGAGARTASAVTNIVWSDEFNGSSSNVDLTKWTFDISNNGGWGNNEREFYTDRTNNAYVAGGVLHIVGRAELTNFGGTTYRYTSARLKTYSFPTNFFNKTRGQIEFRTKLPHGFGYWPANWTLGTNINSQPWPRCGEIDVMEHFGTAPATVHGTVHGPGYSGRAGITASCPVGSSLGRDFHVYSVSWEPGQIRCYVNDELYHAVTPADLGGKPWVFDHDFFLLINVAVGGTASVEPDSSVIFPQTMLIDYIRIYAPAATPA